MQPKDLKKYQEQLLQMRARLRGEVDSMIDSLNQETNVSGNLSRMPIHLADSADEGAETAVNLLHNEQDILAEVNAALARIEEGTYGTCEDCEEEISRARLDAIPYTPTCVQCAEKRQQAT